MLFSYCKNSFSCFVLAFVPGALRGSGAGLLCPVQPCQNIRFRGGGSCQQPGGDAFKVQLFHGRFIRHGYGGGGLLCVLYGLPGLAPGIQRGGLPFAVGFGNGQERGAGFALCLVECIRGGLCGLLRGTGLCGGFRCGLLCGFRGGLCGGLCLCGDLCRGAGGLLCGCLAALRWSANIRLYALISSRLLKRPAGAGRLASTCPIWNRCAGAL